MRKKFAKWTMPAMSVSANSIRRVSLNSNVMSVRDWHRAERLPRGGEVTLGHAGQGIFAVLDRVAPAPSEFPRGAWIREQRSPFRNHLLAVFAGKEPAGAGA